MVWYVVVWSLLLVFPGKIRVDPDGWSIVPLWKCVLDGFTAPRVEPVKPVVVESKSE